MARRTGFFYTAMSSTDALRLMLAAGIGLVLGNRTGGTWRRRFEQEWSSSRGASDSVAFPSARASITAVLRALKIGWGDEVILPGYTCVAVADAVRFAGATIVWADVDLVRMSSTVETSRKAITPRTRALFIQHTLGIPADTESLISLGREHNLVIVEDACHATASREGGAPLGNQGDVAVYSFELSKTLSAGWGGIVQVNNADMVEPIRSVQRSAGWLPRGSASRRMFQAGLSKFIHAPSTVRITGYLGAVLYKAGLFADSSSHTDPPENKCGGQYYLASQGDQHWRVLLRQLEDLPHIADRSQAATARYQSVLEDLGLYGWPDMHGDDTRLIRFPLLVNSPDAFIHFMIREGIEIGRWFQHPVDPGVENPADYNYAPGDCPNGEWLGKYMVNLPVHSRLSSGDLQRICGHLRSYFESHPEDLDLMHRTASGAIT